MTKLKADPRWVPPLLTLSLCLGFGIGCSRLELSHAGEGALVSSKQALPFHPEPVVTDERPAVPPDSKSVRALPFHSEQQPGILQSGTLLTVQLEKPLSFARARPEDTFLASVAAPFTMDGQILVDRGTVVTGHVESAHLNLHGGILSRGYFRLTLSTITIDGRHISLQTSSLFTRGSPVSKLRPAGVGLEKGHHLTFRLTAPATIPALLKDRNSMAGRPILPPYSEQEPTGPTSR